jgi:chemotaxis protein histidine kinase CheA
VLQGANLLRGDRATRSVYLGKGAQALPVEVTAWRADAIELRLPENAPLGATTLTAYLGQRAVGPLAFTVVDPKDATFHEEDAVALEEDDLDYVRDLLHDLKAVAKTDDAQALDEFAAKLEKLLEQAEKGELTKEQLLAKVDEAFEELSKGATPDPSEVNKDLQETGKELAKQEVTQELGRALEQGDLQKAKEELEKLAEKLDKNELSPEQKEQVAQAMDKAAEAFEKKEQQRDQKQAQQQQKLEEEKRTLEKKKEQAKNDQEREELERRLEKNKRELKQLEKEKQEREGSEQKRALKPLHKDMQKAAKEMQKKPQDQQEQQQQDQQASRNLRDVARETGRVDQDQRKQAAQKKVASQMEDLREALRRAKRRGSKGPSDPIGKNKQSDFRRRAQGQKGSRQAWKPGQGQPGKGQQGQGQNGQGQQGQGQNGQGQQGDSYGDEHDPNIVGDATGKSGDTKDESLSGVHGKGPSRRETILAAAQKGFASRSYQQVFADYKTIVEEVMRAEKVPASKKFYVKKYFNNIKPHSVSPGADGE